MSLQFRSQPSPTNAKNLKARAGVLETIHGKIQTPMFMPVGTAGTVKGVLPQQLKEMGAEIILANTYHLWLRPGVDTLKSVGGLRAWMGWEGPLLTDSGGFQVFSLAKLRKITDEGVEFQNHLDGSKMFLSPEESLRIQEAIGSTINMVLDVCPALPASEAELSRAVDQTSRWAKRSLAARSSQGGALFAIVQGGLDATLRLRHLDELQSMKVENATGAASTFDGYALGGLSVGEEPAAMHELVDKVASKMPLDKVRYLMGVGTPSDLLHAIGSGVDIFDCVMPTRNARHGVLFTWQGSVHIGNLQWERDLSPVDMKCHCYTCRNFSKSYLRHLHHSKEILAAVLCSIHNLSFYLDLMKEVRTAIAKGNFEDFSKSCLEHWRSS